MVDFLMRHPTFTVAFIGSFIFTFISQLGEKGRKFAKDYLISSGNFTIGSLGIACLVHCDWTHFALNMVISVPTIILCESFYGEPFCFIVMVLFMFTSSMSTLITKYDNCGFSGVAYLFLSMCCFYGKHIIPMIIFITIFYQEIYTLFKNRSPEENTAIHVIGGVLGIVIALLR